MGIVEKVGPAVTNHKPGDRVVVSFQIACGECEYCKQEFPLTNWYMDVHIPQCEKEKGTSKETFEKMSCPQCKVLMTRKSLLLHLQPVLSQDI